MSVYDLAKEFDNKYRAVPYPERPVKPKREDFPNNAAHGLALDKYDAELANFRDKQSASSAEAGRIESEFKTALGKELGVSAHPKFDKMYSIAYSHGHSSGFTEVAMYAEELSELLTEVPK